MSYLFKAIEGSAVVLSKRGLFKQVEVAERNGELYARFSGGYIRLLNSGWTSYGDIQWSDLDVPWAYQPILAKVGALKIDTGRITTG